MNLLAATNDKSRLTAQAGKHYSIEQPHCNAAVLITPQWAHTRRIVYCQMASEPGLIAAVFSRSLERKKKAETNDLTLGRRNKDRKPQGRQQSGRNSAKARSYSTNSRGGCVCGVFLLPDAVHWRGICYGGVAVSLSVWLPARLSR